jgi:hypothetical protein
VAVTSDPEVPVEGDEITLTSTGSGGTFVRWELTSTPDESDLETGFLLRGGEYLDAFTADTAGEYGVTAYGYVYRKDPVSGIALTQPVLVGSESSTVHVAVAMDLPITTTLGHGATLRLSVLDETIADAALVLPLTELSRVAALDTAVVAALVALVDQDVTAIGTALATQANNLGLTYADHATDGTSHPLAVDSYNSIERDETSSRDEAIVFVNYLAGLVTSHASAGSEETVPWHLVGDTKNTLLAPRATTLPGAVVLLADLRERVYERHRVQTASPGVHPMPDATNPLSAPTLQDAVIVAYLDAIADASPSAVAGEPEGATLLAGAWGYRRA